MEKKTKKWLCGGLVIGVTACLCLSQCSEFRSHKNDKKQAKTEKISKQDTTAIDSTEIKEKQKLLGYSPTDAFKYGVVNSITEYVEKVQYDVDTVDYAGKDDDYIQFGYYRDDDGRIVVCYVKPDTISIPGLSVEDKRRILSFAEYYNSESFVKATIAHESGHQSTNPNKKMGKDINVPGKTERSVFEYNTTAEETALVAYHDELRGRFFSFLYTREQFKENNDSIIIDVEYPWYKDAIDRGYIDPFSPDPRDQQKEQIFCMRNIKADFEQLDIDSYTENAIIRMNEHPAYDEEKSGEYVEALNFCHTYIWDGKLANLNFFTQGTISDFELPSEVKLAAEEKEEIDAYQKDEEQKARKREAEAQNDHSIQSDTTRSDTTVTTIPASYYKSYSR